jgi:hypothetical protein
MSEGDAAELAAALKEPGEHGVDTDVFCVLTRFGLRSPHHLIPTLRDYRRVVHDARAAQVPGLLRHAFLVESPRSCFSLSIWSERPYFSADVPRHVEAARRVFGRVRFEPEHGPEVWSTKWRLTSVTNNLRWADDFDLRALLVDRRRASA